MSNKPNIYAFCPAGCKWETVHKSDYESSLPLVSYRATGENQWNVEEGVKYKIHRAPDAESWSLNIVVTYNNTPATVNLTLPEYDAYKDYFYFRLYAVELVDGGTLKITYDINEERQTYTDEVQGETIYKVMGNTAGTISNAYKPASNDKYEGSTDFVNSYTVDASTTDLVYKVISPLSYSHQEMYDLNSVIWKYSRTVDGKVYTKVSDEFINQYASVFCELNCCSLGTATYEWTKNGGYEEEEVNTVINGADKVYIVNEESGVSVNPINVYIRYADDDEGTNMTDTYTDQQYMGVYTGVEASINPSDYTWSKFVGDVPDGSITLAKQDITYSNQTLTAASWVALADASPFIYKYEISYTLADTDEISLIANYLDLATYGLMISEATTTTITIVATSLPTSNLNITLKVVK